MTQEKRLSDEFLNAFVDNQLAAEEKSRTYIEISRDESLNRQVCELRKLHDLVQLAYYDLPVPPTRRQPAARTRRLRFGIAASVVLAVGIALGIQVGDWRDNRGVAAPSTSATASPVPASPHLARPARLVAAAPRALPAQLAVADAPLDAPVVFVPRHTQANDVKNKVLIHIADDDRDHLDQALIEIEGALRYYRDSHQAARVEVVVNGRGLELVRTDTSEHAARIQRLQREYDNLTFAACQNTIDRLESETRIKVHLLPGVITIDSGMAEIMRRQNQGWTYLQV